MSKPAARIGDMHVCPMVTPGVPPIPHVGGPVTGPGVPTVLIGGKPAAVMGDMCVCTGPPDTIVLGSMGVLIGGKPAARMGDMCAHGGTIVLGQPNVLIGEMSPGAPGTPAGMAAMANFMNEVKSLPGGEAGALAARQVMTLNEAAVDGAPFCEICEQARQEQEEKNKASRGGTRDASKKNDETQVQKKINKLYFKDVSGKKIEEVNKENKVFLVIEGENIVGEEIIVNLFDNPGEFTYKGKDVENDQLIITASADDHEIELGIKPRKGMRTGAYDQTVVYQSEVPEDSVGWDEENQKVFEGLGHERHPIGTWKQECEQVYLLSNMEKGGIDACIQIAKKYQIGIAVRGTGTLAHMGIESGGPTKAQEFKNKTSKQVDLLLCDELNYVDLGSVVHFDPRVGWNSAKGNSDAAQGKTPDPLVPQVDWGKKKKHILQSRLNQIEMMPSDALIKILELGKEKIEEKAGESQTEKKKRIVEVVGKETWSGWGNVEKKFEGRVKEYIAENPEYREGGHYYEHAHIEGIHLRVKQRPDDTMVGDHDLFGFTDLNTNTFLSDKHHNVLGAQRELQESSGFQAQHGGIWNWDAPDHQKHIKDVIMGAHGPEDDEPLVYITTDEERPVYAAFYVKGSSPRQDKVRSAWDYSANRKWYPEYYQKPENQKDTEPRAQPNR